MVIHHTSLIHTKNNTDGFTLIEEQENELRLLIYSGMYLLDRAILLLIPDVELKFSCSMVLDSVSTNRIMEKKGGRVNYSMAGFAFQFSDNRRYRHAL